jgi:uncharacterized protein
VKRVLVEKFNWSPQRAQLILRNVLERATRVTLEGTVHVCRDPDDDLVLECAERAEADLIITGDQDLLSLRSHGVTRIITPAAYLRL